jgi:Tol biopolymer transport system component
VDPDAKGKKASKVGTPVLLAEGDFFGPTWSPDGTRIAYHSWGKIAVLDLTTGVESRLESMGGILPSWSPAGDRIAFVSTANSTYGQLYVMNADFSNVSQLTDYTDAGVYWPSWSDDGTQLAFRLSIQEGANVLSYDIYKMTLATGEVTLVQEWGDHPDWMP